MSRESPEAAFEHARAAMARGDLPEVFSCLDVNDLNRIAENAVALSIGSQIERVDDEVRRICRDYGFLLDEILAAWRRILKSPGIEATMASRTAMKQGLAAVTNLPAFLALLEGYSRRTSGGGSISMRLFQQEQLIDVHVDGSRAWGTRVFGPGSSDDVEFVRRKGEWFIKLIARPKWC